MDERVFISFSKDTSTEREKFSCIFPNAVKQDGDFYSFLMAGSLPEIVKAIKRELDALSILDFDSDDGCWYLEVYNGYRE